VYWSISGEGFVIFFAYPLDHVETAIITKKDNKNIIQRLRNAIFLEHFGVFLHTVLEFSG
jgi:hypothetical protein